MMFALIKPRKESVTNMNVDVYMAPLIEELQELWKRIDCLDGSQRNSKKKHSSYMACFCGGKLSIDSKERRVGSRERKAESREHKILKLFVGKF